MTQPLIKLATTLMLIHGLLAPLSVSAEFIAQERAVEANQVTILFSNGVEEGTAMAQECLECPLTLGIDAQTRFFHNGKEIRRNKVEQLSGGPATIIYSKDGKQALRIRW